MNTVTLQTHVTHRVKDREYNRSRVTIPQELKDLAGWRDNQTLHAEQRGSKIILTPTERPTKPQKPAYETFRDAIKQALTNPPLTTAPEGLTWTELERKTNWKQKTPPASWVMRLEYEEGLKRTRCKDFQVRWSIQCQKQ